MPVDLTADTPLDGAIEAAVASDAARLLEALSLPDAELSVLLCGDARIQELNRDWRGIDAATDVLSFPQGTLPGGVPVLGDVVVSVPTAARQAADAGHDLRAELRVLLVHGVCHLLGHDHHDEAEARVMRAEEERLLRALGEGAAGLVRRASALDR